MPSKGTARASYRLDPVTRSRLKWIGSQRGGLDESSTLRIIIDEAWKKTVLDMKKILTKSDKVS